MGRREQPLQPGPLYEFARALRELRTSAGALSYRVLSRKAGYSPSALSSAAAGQMLPTLAVTLAYVGACGGDLAHWEQRWQEVAQELRRTNPDLLSPAGDAGQEVEHQDGDQAPVPEPATVVEEIAVAEELIAPHDPDPRRAHTPAGLAPLGKADPEDVGPYRLLGRLGTGAMGRVYLGRDTATGTLAAIKVIRPDLADDSTFRRRFQRELRTLQQVRNPYIAELVNADADAEQPWLATRYLPAVTLQQAIDTHGPLPASTVAVLAAGIAHALAALHAAGVVHRDLKPSNVLLGADGPQVIDFGIARVLEGTHLTATGTHLGSAAFMAPEQAIGSPVGPPADMFSFGALIAYALTGVPPFGEGSPESVLYRVVHNEPDLRALSSLDNNLAALAAAGLTKDPAGRPTAAEALDALPPAPAGGAWLPPSLVMSAEPGADSPPAENGGSHDPHPVESNGQASATAPAARPRITMHFGLAPLLVAAAIIAAILIAQGTGHDQLQTIPTAPSPSMTPLPPSGPTAQPSPTTAPAATRGTAAAHGTGGTRGSAVGATARARVVPSPSRAVGPAQVQTRYSFEDTVSPWGSFWNDNYFDASITDQIAYDGSHALNLEIDPSSSRSPAIGTTHIDGLRPGATVTFHIWYGGHGEGQLKPFVQDTGYAEWWSTTPLSLGGNTGWTTYTWKVPNVPLRGIGFQVDNPGPGDLVIDLDAVAW